VRFVKGGPAAATCNSNQGGRIVANPYLALAAAILGWHWMESRQPVLPAESRIILTSSTNRSVPARHPPCLSFKRTLCRTNQLGTAALPARDPVIDMPSRSVRWNTNITATSTRVSLDKFRMAWSI